MRRVRHVLAWSAAPFFPFVFCGFVGTVTLLVPPLNIIGVVLYYFGWQLLDFFFQAFLITYAVLIPFYFYAKSRKLSRRAFYLTGIVIGVFVGLASGAAISFGYFDGGKIGDYSILADWLIGCTIQSLLVFWIWMPLVHEKW